MNTFSKPNKPVKQLIPVPVPKPAYVKLTVLKDIQDGSAFYRKGDEIEVFHHEAVKLVQKFEDGFEVVVS